jgi:hypothetical protein
VNVVNLALTMSLLLALPVSAEQQADSSAVIQTGAVTLNAPSQRLGDVNRICVASFGSGEGADLIRQKVINRFIKSGGVTVVDSPAEADATLSGAAELDPLRGGTRYMAEGVVNLVGRDKRILWTEDVASRRFLFPSHSAKGASNAVADKMVKLISEAITADKNQVVSK